MDTAVFRVDRRAADQVNVLAPSGRITMGASVRQMKQAFERLAAEGNVAVALNLSAVPYVDSAGLGSIFNGLNLLRKKGGNMALCCVQPPVSQLLELAHLSGLVASFESEAAAVEALNKGTAPPPTR
jgi:anti-anti-sigma factor